MEYLQYSTLVDTALVIGLAVTVWIAYRELRRRTRGGEHAANQMPDSSAS